MKSRTYYIYSLSDPRNSIVRYIGATINPEARLKSHVKQLNGSALKIAWIAELIENGLDPIMTILYECSCQKEAKTKEIEYYNTYNQTQIYSDNPSIRIYSPSSREFNYQNNLYSKNEPAVVSFLRNPFLNLTVISKEMYPNNKASAGYLMKKLNGSRPFTNKDQHLALSALKKLKNTIDNLTLQ